jgi:hypothetical protein
MFISSNYCLRCRGCGVKGQKVCGQPSATCLTQYLSTLEEYLSQDLTSKWFQKKIHENISLELGWLLKVHLNFLKKVSRENWPNPKATMTCTM